MATELVPEVILIIPFSMCIFLDLIVTSFLSFSVFVLLSSGTRDSLRPSISQLISVLLECFKDDSWPVRDGEGNTSAHLT